jgi:uncharacterized membrane protein
LSIPLVLRLVHIILGVFWAGTVFFLVLFLAPAMGRVGPDSGKVMVQINKARFFEIMPLAALITILSGTWLMWIDSNGFGAPFFGSHWGVSLTVGGVAALMAFLVGTLIMRPATLRMLALGPRLGAAQSDEERGALGAQMDVLRRRSRTSSVWVAWLLLLAVAAMAGARYL